MKQRSLTGVQQPVNRAQIWAAAFAFAECAYATGLEPRSEAVRNKQAIHAALVTSPQLFAG